MRSGLLNLMTSMMFPNYNHGYHSVAYFLRQQKYYFLLLTFLTPAGQTTGSKEKTTLSPPKKRLIDHSTKTLTEIAAAKDV